jgi:hypothetical protein
LRQKVKDVLLPRVIAGLTQPCESAGLTPAPAPAADAGTAPRDIVFTGTLDEVQEHFYERRWSDGLPIIPPTLDRVERFLRFTEREPDEVLGVTPPANRQATVWNVAVNGVMAGCRPEYMPILLAVVEAIVDPAYKVEDAGSTPGWESLIVLSGPIIKELGFNSGQGVMRVGKQANTSIGRFLRLYLRNLAGFHHAPEALTRQHRAELSGRVAGERGCGR